MSASRLVLFIFYLFFASWLLLLFLSSGGHTSTPPSCYATSEAPFCCIIVLHQGLGLCRLHLHFYPLVYFHKTIIWKWLQLGLSPFSVHGCIPTLLKAVCSPLKKILAVNINLLLGMRLQCTWLKEIASLQCSGHPIGKVYLLCQHNS